MVDGQRNLLELTKGVRLTSMTKVVDQIVEGSTTATRVQGVIRGAVPVEEHYQNDIYTVTLAMPIGGELLQAVLPEQADLAFQNPTRIQRYSRLFRLETYSCLLYTSPSPRD